MPFSADFANEYIGTPDNVRVSVFTGMRTVVSLKNPKLIQVDGRRYSLDGRVHFKNGVTLSAKMELDTAGFDLLVLNSVKVYSNGLWYKWYEIDLVNQIGATTSDDILPFTWTPLIPINYKTAPYPMRFHETAIEKLIKCVRLLHQGEVVPLNDNDALLYFDPVYWQ